MNKSLLILCLFYSGIMSQTIIKGPIKPPKNAITCKVIDSSRKADMVYVKKFIRKISFSYSVGGTRLIFSNICNKCVIEAGSSLGLKCNRPPCSLVYFRGFHNINRVRLQLNGMLKNMDLESMKRLLSKDHGKIFTMEGSDENNWVKLERM